MIRSVLRTPPKVTKRGNAAAFSLVYPLSITSASAQFPRFTTEFPRLSVIFRDSASTGSSKSRKLRKEGLVPGVLYGMDQDRNVLKSLIAIDQKELLRELRVRGSSFENTLYEIQTDGVTVHAIGKTVSRTPSAGNRNGEKFLVTPRQAQFCPRTDAPVSVNFLVYSPGSRLRIPIEYINEDLSQDLRRGCFLIRVNHYIECVCDEEVPAKIVVDLSTAQKGDVLRLNALQLPPKVRPAKTVPLDFVLAVVKAGRGG
mmetsp:Transcript_24493/g.40837  ORF Transcript_24493/g.40837 Transcript_24493/m.40837 type:complete len:257 (+) Transcript_24493:84-854(+)|eukprot:CAMPEP_0174969410 /NCGR_PEP_ID=MMETSP0004_2-20121128/8745_1 /TAXON_ID=420556 /ORGANISM="Ochromonas sp., Strain CCMP1393" /LENGTH=256 /DNA_ID=CAMNT_0016218893 /DNA_START=81 /DNA_END=851 /DNA_ORIENTATION=-